jgi:site-specific DNA recombinase
VPSVLASSEGKTFPPGGPLRHPTKKAKTDPLKAVAYLRVSTDEQTLGMEAQRAAITDWAHRQGVQVALWCEDLGVSGGAELEKRPGLLEALRAVRDLRAGFLVAHKADRVARDVYVSELVKRELRAAGAAVALVEGICGDDPFSEMAATVMDAAARLERRMIAARTKAALGVKKAKGEKTGGSVPFGFRLMPDGIHLGPHPVEHPVLLRILDLRRAGLGGRKIAAALTAEGHHPRGAAWNPGNLQVLADRLMVEDVVLCA